MRSCLVIHVTIVAMVPGLPLGAAEPARPSENLTTTPDSTSTGPSPSPSELAPPEQPSTAPPSKEVPSNIAATPTLAPAPKPEPSASSLQDICKLDPSACPTVQINAVQMTGPLAAAPAVGLRHGDIGAKVDKRFVMPSGYAEVRGELAFITSDAIVTPRRLKFGDVALFRPSARRAFGEKVELSFGTTLLAKEPTAMQDWAWQSASLGVTFEPVSGYAVILAGSGGPLLDGLGSVWSAAGGLAAKWSLDRHTRVLLSISDLFTALDEVGRMAAHAWLNEVVFGGEAQIGENNAAAWVSVNYAIPVAKAGDVPNSPTPVALEPTVRMDLQVGGVLRGGKRDDWDLFAYYSWIDRGEMGRPGTLLPVLDGGFDQQQIVLGVGHRFAPAMKGGDDDAAFSR